MTAAVAQPSNASPARTCGPTPKAFGVDYNSAAPGKMAALLPTTSALYSLKEVASECFCEMSS